MRRALLALLAAGCDAPPASAPPPVDAGPGRPGFVDGGDLADGTVVREDAAEPLPDAAFFTDGGVCPSGAASGIVCVPEGDRPIAGAEVVAATRDCDGEPTTVSTLTGRDGSFKLSGLAPGLAEVTIRAGNFLATFPVEIFDGADVPIVDGPSRKVCLKSDSARLAVLSGDYDRIQDLIDGLGFGHDLVCGDTRNHRSGRALLQDWDALRQRDVVFVNCATGIDLRATNAETRRIVDNLRRFVAGGGSVYVSDLSADFVGHVWPGFVDFSYTAARDHEEPACCVCGADCDAACVVAEPGPPQSCPTCCDLPNDTPESCAGEGLAIMGRGLAQRVPAVVNDERLRAHLRGDTIDIDFPLGGWVEMTGVSAGVEVLVEGAPGTAQAGRPLMVLFQPEPGGGRVAYTSFHNHDQASDDMRAILSALIFRL